jgi:hypothetical protein
VVNFYIYYTLHGRYPPRVHILRTIRHRSRTDITVTHRGNACRKLHKITTSKQYESPHQEASPNCLRTVLAVAVACKAGNRYLWWEARVVMRWVPGHEGVEGNERADEEAKRAAKGETSHEWEIPIECRGVLPISRAAEIQRHNAELNRQARAIFAKSPRAPFALEIVPTMTSAAFSRITKDMPRRHTSLLVQLRTGHVALNKYLHKIGKADSPLCPACRSTHETVHHYLFRCPAFGEQRNSLEKRLKRGANSVKTLLGGHKAMKHLFRYIHDTGQFEKSHGDVSLPMEKGRENKR